jgi:hypothetical protein
MEQSLKRFFLLMAILLVVVAISLLVLAVYMPNFKAIENLAGFSTFVIAFLTVIYVYTTNRQLQVMSQQIDEMKLDRELQNQPLPWVESIAFECEKPRLYYSPPTDEHKVLSRYNCNIKLKNIGLCPAVSLNLIAEIYVKRDSEPLCLKAAALYIDTLEEKEVYPSNEKTKDGFLFAEDNDAELLRRLLESDISNYPVLNLSIAYKNVIGASFVLNKVYFLYPSDDSIDDIKLWIKEITSFDVEFKETLHTLKKLHKSNSDKWDEIFDETKESINKKFDREALHLEPTSIPSAFRVIPISETEYTKLCSKVGYGFKIGPMHNECLPKTDS